MLGPPPSWKRIHPSSEIQHGTVGGSTTISPLGCTISLGQTTLRLLGEVSTLDLRRTQLCTTTRVGRQESLAKKKTRMDTSKKREHAAVRSECSRIQMEVEEGLRLRHPQGPPTAAGPDISVLGRRHLPVPLRRSDSAYKSDTVEHVPMTPSNSSVPCESKDRCGKGHSLHVAPKPPKKLSQTWHCLKSLLRPNLRQLAHT